MSHKRLMDFIGNEVHNFDGLYKYNNEYTLKKDENPTLWRYMDLSKLLSLLDTNSLFFAKPKTFIDTYEGNYSKYDLERINPWFLKYFEEGFKLSDFVAAANEYAGVICWHMNDFESAAMWDLYLSSSEGIAIKTNYKRLMGSQVDNRFFVYPGKVKYIDYHNEMASLNVFETLFYKRKSFYHENELRLLALADPIIDDGHNINSYETYTGDKYKGTVALDTEFGANLKWDLSKLIEAIYIAPKAPNWFASVVESVLIKYGLNDVEVIQSDLYKDLIY
ncbi:DUF2971 domain-containing protein [Peribacillus frigoritolerans]|uniref:DUF2971 domain-containing protein n=1 Tax=Peribacillus frigoritolerans TaxID=450367 RepID=UPI002E1DE1C0|nr:DUF2971 domain-containing protein [Peribacillus frigoritolerans]